MKLTTVSYQAKPHEVESQWYVVDATDVILGRLSTEVASRIMGKHKAQFSPHALTGDTIIVINAAKVATSGNKLLQKKYYRHSGYPGGLKETTLEEMLEKNPTYVVKHAVKGMLPKNKLAVKMLGRLHVYADDQHPHEAQQPKELKVK